MFDFPGAAIRVLLADDADALRRAILGLLDENSEILVVGEASNASDAVGLARRLKPQVILVDLHMLRDTPTNLLRALSAETPHLLAMSWAPESEAADLAGSIGASIVLDKMNLSEELIPTILKLGSANANQVATSA